MAHNFVDVLLPLPLPKPYTYAISGEEFDRVTSGFRVLVPFGKRKWYTAIVVKKHNVAPQTYEAKKILFVFEERPLLLEKQLLFWKWMASYYLCPMGSILKAALPSPLLLESESEIIISESPPNKDYELTNEQKAICKAIESSPMSVGEIASITERKNNMPLVLKLMALGYIEIHQKLVSKYIPKKSRYIRLSNKFQDEKAFEELFSVLKKAPKQTDVILSLLTKPKEEWVIASKIKKQANVKSTVLRTLIGKEIIEEKWEQHDRLHFSAEQTQIVKDLSEAQQESLGKIRKAFRHKNVVLFQGVTASGKTEVYMELIEEILAQNKQVLYLLPEISLTSQIVQRLLLRFNEKVSVYHSKFSIQERTEIWQNICLEKANTQIIVGARSALLLPFTKLGLVIVDEEHEASYKQFDPAPRYHARDSAIYMAQLFDAKVILGSATPTVESTHNAQMGKYGWVQLKQRYGKAQFPKIECISLKEAHRKKQVKGVFTNELIEAMQNVLAAKGQIILFQNRRGFAPIVECLSCGHAPCCTQCDVTLTYHKTTNQLHCHYCGYHTPMPSQCHACGMPTLETKGVGTQQIQAQVENLFPKVKVARMDWDSTRGKYDFEKIIEAFTAQQTQILVGTQMLVKGLDFSNVNLVGVLNADHLLHFPNFRAHERCFQMLVQVAGRAGRSEKPGRVLVQTFQPHHPVIQQVVQYNYEDLFEQQLKERKQFEYPPFCRLIRVTLKNKNFQSLNQSTEWYANVLKQLLSVKILGPTFPPISRIRNLYLKEILIKIDSNHSVNSTKKHILKVQQSFESIAAFKSTRINIDVDPF